MCLRTQAVSKKPGFIPKRRAMSIEESQKISTTLIPPPPPPSPAGIGLRMQNIWITWWFYSLKRRNKHLFNLKQFFLYKLCFVKKKLTENNNGNFL